MLIHRADYQQLLFDAANELGANIILNARVESVDDNAISIKTADGKVYKGDLIIGADGK